MFENYRRGKVERRLRIQKRLAEGRAPFGFGDGRDPGHYAQNVLPSKRKRGQVQVTSWWAKRFKEAGLPVTQDARDGFYYVSEEDRELIDKLSKFHTIQGQALGANMAAEILKNVHDDGFREKLLRSSLPEFFIDLANFLEVTLPVDLEKCNSIARDRPVLDLSLSGHYWHVSPEGEIKTCHPFENCERPRFGEEQKIEFLIRLGTEVPGCHLAIFFPGILKAVFGTKSSPAICNRLAIPK